MADNVKCLLTNYGRAMIAQALANETQVVVTAMYYGNGNNSSYVPDPAQGETGLRDPNWKNQKIDALALVEDETWTFFEGVIPANAPDIVIRELGVADATGKLLIVATIPEVNKVTSVNGVSQRIPIRIGITIAEGQVMTIIPDSTTVPPFTQQNLGLIKGRIKDGYVAAMDSSTGYGKVVGWDTLLRSKSEQPQGVDSSFVFSNESKISYVSTEGYYQYTIGANTFYATRPVQVGDVVYGNNTFSDIYGVVSNITDTTITIANAIRNTYSLQSSVGYYVYSINGLTLYSSTPLATGIILYTTNAMTVPYGTVVDVNGSLSVVTIQQNGSPRYNGAYSISVYDVMQLKTSPELIVQLGNTNSHLQLATNDSAESYGNHITVDTPNGLKTIPYIEDNIEPYVTNYIETSNGDATFTSNSITLPTMELVYPNGRNLSDNTLQNISEVVDGTTYTGNTLKDRADANGDFFLFYIKSLGTITPDFNSLVISNSYTKWTTNPPTGSFNYGDVWYSNENEMYVTTDNSPNYTVTGSTDVTNGVVSNLGTLTAIGTNYNSSSLNQVINFDFTTGTVTSNQDLFKIPYAFGTISNSTLKLFAYSTAYQVNYHLIKNRDASYTENSAQTKTLYTYIINGNTYYTQELATIGTNIYTDTEFTQLYGTVSNITGNTITVSTIDNVGTYNYTLIPLTYYTYSLGGTSYYTQPVNLTNGLTVYSDTALTNVYGVVDDLNTTDLQLKVIENIIDNKAYTLISSSANLYEYDIDGTTYYTSETLDINVDVYSDNSLTTKIGSVSAIDTVNGTVSVTNTKYSGFYNNLTPTYYTYSLDGTNYYTTEALALGVPIYSDNTLYNYFGYVKSMTVSNVTVEKEIYNTYNYSYTSSSVYAYNIGLTTIYSRTPITIDMNVYSDSDFHTIYGEVESITYGSNQQVTIRENNTSVGYVGIQGTGFVSQDISIYSDSNMFNQVESSTGLNASYTNISQIAEVEICSKTVTANTQYTGSLTLTGSALNNATFTLVLNGLSDTIIWSEKTLNMTANNSFVFGGNNGFNGTIDLANTGFTAWTWNGVSGTSIDRVKSIMCELGTVTKTNGQITNVQLNKPIEVVKKSDLEPVIKRKQNKLIAGAYIELTDNADSTTISTTGLLNQSLSNINSVGQAKFDAKQDKLQIKDVSMNYMTLEASTNPNNPNIIGLKNLQNSLIAGSNIYLNNLGTQTIISASNNGMGNFDFSAYYDSWHLWTNYLPIPVKGYFIAGVPTGQGMGFPSNPTYFVTLYLNNIPICSPQLYGLANTSGSYTAGVIPVIIPVNAGDTVSLNAYTIGVNGGALGTININAYYAFIKST